MHKLTSFCIGTLIIICNTTQATTPDSTYPDFEDKYKDYHKKHIDPYLKKLENDLSMFDQTDIDAIIEKVKKGIKDHARYFLTRDEIYTVAKGAIVSHGELMQRIVAQEFYNNEDRIKRVVKSQRENISAILNKSNDIDGRALAFYFGRTLLAKTEQDAQHPDNKPHLKPEYHYWFSEPAPKPVFDPNKRHRMYEDYGHKLAQSWNEQTAAEMKKIFWRECMLCHTESTINACMQQQVSENIAKIYIKI